MKRKVLVTLCLCMIGLAGTVTGCGSKKEETPVVEEEKKEPELKAIGQEDKEAFKVEVKNATGKNIKGVAIKLTDEDAYPENMLEEGDVFADQESRNLYYKALEKNENEDVTEESETTENDGTDSNGQEVTYTGISTTHKFTKTGKTAKAINVDLSKDLADVRTFFDTVTTIDTLKAKA